MLCAIGPLDYSAVWNGDDGKGNSPCETAGGSVERNQGRLPQGSASDWLVRSVRIDLALLCGSGHCSRGRSTLCGL